MLKFTPLELAEQETGFIVKQHQIVYFGLWLIVPFCSLISHTVIPIPPTLILFLFGAVLLFALMAGQKIYERNVIAFPVFAIAYYFISQTMMAAPFERYVGVVLAIAYFPVVASFGNAISADKRLELTEKFISFSVIILIIECVWRITHPESRYAVYAGTGDVRWIYQYKVGGIMYSDSNVVSFHILTIFFFVLYMEREEGMKFRKTKFILLALLLLTFSRAAWIGTAIGYIYIRYLRKKPIHFYLINLIAIGILTFFFYQFYLKEKISTDPSFKSKINIAHAVIEYFSEASFLELVFGVGFSNSIDRLGIYAHNFFIVYLIESGIIGLVVVLLLFLHFIFITRGKALFVLVPFFITTLSNTVTFMPYFYVMMALIYVGQSQKAERKKELTAGDEN